jgi:hypothetical protein
MADQYAAASKRPDDFSPIFAEDVAALLKLATSISPNRWEPSQSRDPVAGRDENISFWLVQDHRDAHHGAAWGRLSVHRWFEDGQLHHSIRFLRRHVNCELARGEVAATLYRRLLQEAKINIPLSKTEQSLLLGLTDHLQFWTREVDKGRFYTLTPRPLDHDPVALRGGRLEMEWIHDEVRLNYVTSGGVHPLELEKEKVQSLIQSLRGFRQRRSL